MLSLKAPFLRTFLTQLPFPIMHPSLLFLFLLLPLCAASPPFHPLRLPTKPLPPAAAGEQKEISRPLPFDSLTPACTLPLLSATFAAATTPTTANYSAPSNCSWSAAVLHLSAAVNGTQSNRIAAIWLSGAELLRTSTPSAAGTFWNVRKDITRYSALLRRSNLNLSLIVNNTIDQFLTGVFHVNITILFYNVKHNPLKNSLDLDFNPADLIIPISSAGEEGFWYKIQSEYEPVFHGIQIPVNTYRAVLEVYISSHDDDEFWYMNPPDNYIESNELDIKRGHGSYREVIVKLDDNVVGSVIPFPVIYTGGINPLYWNPIVAIGAFNLPSYEIELTPFLGILLDNKTHDFGFTVADAIPFWLINANLHLWIDEGADIVQAGPIKNYDPSNYVDRESSFVLLNGKFETGGKRVGEFSGWVYSSSGNFTTHVKSKLEFENEINYEKNGSKVTVEHEVKMKKKIEVQTPDGDTVMRFQVESKYPLDLDSETVMEADSYMVKTEFEQSYKEQKTIGDFESGLENKQECKGWMVMHGEEMLSGRGSISQTYEVEDSLGCYARKVEAEGGVVSKDSVNFLCASARVADASI